MTYRDTEKARIISIRDTLFRDEGDGLFKGIPYPFVLKNPILNLWEGIREDTYRYFEENKIAWWSGEKSGVTGHLLSSQVACLNHLFPLRQREDMATAILKALRVDIVKAERMDSGFVEFEVVGRENYLGERSHSRGINATSIDAVMVGKKKSGANILVIIEWKYTEEYGGSDLYIPARADIYDPLMARKDSPLRAENPDALYYEPFYQLMRQTLLGWLMVENGEYGCDEYLHVHVIPEKNKVLRETITSPKLAGDSMSDAWKRMLNTPSSYLVLSPRKLLEPIAQCADTSSLTSYLEKRYWGGDT
jgi:hypothetical protein